MTSARVGIVIQARMGSTRLPGKVLMPIGGTPLLDLILDRLERSRTRAAVVVATSGDTRNDVIASHCLTRRVACFRGSEQDVLDRYVACARAHDFAHVLRLTADNPFTDIVELDRLVATHLRESNDYTHSFGSLPIGVGAEIFTRHALERSAAEGHAPNHREHVNEYIQENPDSFRIGTLEIPAAKCCPALRLTVDTSEDHARASVLVTEAGPAITTEEAIARCSVSA